MILHFDKLAFKTESRVVRPLAWAISPNPILVVVNPYSVSQSSAEFIKNQIPKFHSHLEILIHYDWGEPQNTSHMKRTQLILRKTIQRGLFEKTALEFFPSTKQDDQSP